MSHYFTNDYVESKEVKTKCIIKNTELTLITDNGVFSKKGLDFGTRVLLENIDINNKNSFLDVGCGCGPIGMYILLNKPDSVVDMIDVNDRAIKLTKMGLKKNHITLLNC